MCSFFGCLSPIPSFVNAGMIECPSRRKHKTTPIKKSEGPHSWLLGLKVLKQEQGLER